MNRIWEPVVKMQMKDMDRSALGFRAGNNRVSPYIELCAESLYEQDLTEDQIRHIDINPYIRFSEIFSPFLTADVTEYEEFNEQLVSVLLHYLAELDICLGRSKREYYLEFLIRDLERGVYCTPDRIRQFIGEEKRVLAEGLLTLYETKDSFTVLVTVFRKLLPFCQIYMRDREEVVFYMRENEQETIQQRIQTIIWLFLPISYPYTIHWMKTYGIAGYDGTMRLEDFIL